MGTELHRIEEKTAGELVEAISICRSDIAATLADIAEGWCIAPYDPSAMLARFPSLRLRRGMRLAAYHFRVEGHNNGVVFVVPEDRELPSASDVEWQSIPGPGEPLRPEGIPPWADRRLGPYLEGDGSPLSFFEASILQREMVEIAATWRGCDWQTHTLLTRNPLIRAAHATDDIATDTDPDRQPVPAVSPDWRPSVWLTVGVSAIFEFYTHSRLYRERIVRHRDTFREGYAFETAREVIAEGSDGFIF